MFPLSFGQSLDLSTTKCGHRVARATNVLENRFSLICSAEHHATRAVTVTVTVVVYRTGTDLFAAQGWRASRLETGTYYCQLRQTC
jgi:hypothetical protein